MATKTAKKSKKTAVRASKKASPAQPYVVVRTYSAGVHVGHLVRRNEKQVELRDARRIWKWVGANTLNEIANTGVGVGSKVSAPVGSILLTEAIEIIACAAAGEASLKAAAWAS